MTRISLEQGFYKAKSYISNAQRCLNLFPEAGASDAPAPTTCYLTPGLRLLGSGPNAPVRGLYSASNGQGFAVIGNEVGTVSKSWVFTSIGTLSTNAGPVAFKDNGINVVIVDGSTFAYTITLLGNVFAKLVDPTGTFVGSNGIDFLDTYFLFFQPNSNLWYCSLSNSITFDPLYVATKSSAPDWIAALAVCQGTIWVIGQRTTELWYDAGAADFPFARIQGAIFQHGCIAPASVVVSDTHVWWLGSDAQGQGIVYNGSGGTITRISTHAIEQTFGQFITLADAIGMSYQQDGHNFYLLTFPSADKTFCWDDASQLWHERAWLDTNGFEHRHRANCVANMYGTIVVGDWQNGQLYAFDTGVYNDNGLPIKRVRGFPHLPTTYDTKTGLSHLEGKRIRYDQFIADMECGKFQPQSSTPAGPPSYTSIPTVIAVVSYGEVDGPQVDQDQVDGAKATTPGVF